MTNQFHPATVSGMKYAPIFAGLFLLWPVMAFLGAQGFAPLLGLTALAALPFIQWKRGLALYAIAAAIFIIWAAITETWSPASQGLITGSLAGGDLSIRAASLRIALVLLAAMATIAAVLAIPKGRAKLSSKFVTGTLIIHGLVVLMLVALGPQLLDTIYGTAEENNKAVTDGIQNILRNANAFSVVLPILAALAWTKKGTLWKGVSAGLWAVSLGAFIWLGTQAAIFGVLLALIFIAIVRAAPQHGFKWVMGAVGTYILAAPALLGGGAKLVERFNLPMPGSFQSRLWSWDVVTEKIMERPLTGHGLSASKTWRETYSDHPEWLAQLPDFWATYPVVPGHPHNMPLQIWAETGLVGASLAALAAVLIGWRLPAPESLTPAIRYAIAGFVGASLTLFSFAYSAWNDAFWAMLTLAAGAIILLYRQMEDRPA